ncbi:MAG: Benzylsuccinate synthase activating enzyme [Syntrophomonadaceae bacterium]|nr:Benzylsuccinate synthase activating enzyme [Bacillota bacterium]
MNNSTEIEGLIFNIQRDSTEDGPGIRTTVFLKGCTMHCPWCHNPEGICLSPELVWFETRCIGDGDCIKKCSREALIRTRKGVVIDRNRCTVCGECAVVCHAGALEVLGKKSKIDDVAATILRDRVFYEKSGGGVTISGGEPSLQDDFSAALMRLMRGEGIHIALDTCGGMSWDILGPLVELADLILYDIKLVDEEKHRQYTGIPLEMVLDNARKIAEINKPMWVRTPVIPGYTDSEDNIRRVARFIVSSLPSVDRYDILAFNSTCTGKYHRLGRSWELEETNPLSEKAMEKLAAAARNEGLTFVQWSGLTRSEVQSEE